MTRPLLPELLATTRLGVRGNNPSLRRRLSTRSTFNKGLCSTRKESFIPPPRKPCVPHTPGWGTHREGIGRL